MDQYYVEEDYVDTGYFAVGWVATVDLSSVAALSVSPTVVTPIYGTVDFAAEAALQTTGKGIKPSSVTFAGVTATTAVAARRLTETVLFANTGSLSVTGTATVNRTVNFTAAASQSTIPHVQRSFSVAFGSLGASVETLNSYAINGIPVPQSLQFTQTAALNKLLWEDYLYTIPRERRTYTIPYENRTLTVKE